MGGGGGGGVGGVVRERGLNRLIADLRYTDQKKNSQQNRAVR